jgi:PAS domain S-box-containing protein
VAIEASSVACNPTDRRRPPIDSPDCGITHRLTITVDVASACQRRHDTRAAEHGELIHLQAIRRIRGCEFARLAAGAARFCSARGIVLVGAGCVGLTTLAFFLPGFTETEAGDVGVKASISAAVVGLTTFLIRDRKNAEERLRESEGQWREVFEHNPVMYFMVDATGTILSVNGCGAAQLGYTTAELVGKSVLNIFFEEEREVVKDQLATCVEELGRSHNWEIRKIRKDGRVIWVSENAKAVRRSGNDAVVLIACEDITERRRGEQRVAAQCGGSGFLDSGIS